MNRAQNDIREADFPESRTPWRKNVHPEKAGERAGEKINREPRMEPPRPIRSPITPTGQQAQRLGLQSPWMTVVRNPNSERLQQPDRWRSCVASWSKSPLGAKGYSGVK